jgi:hypothetical protein
MQFWSLFFFSITVWLLFFVKEEEEKDEEGLDMKSAYWDIWRIVRLPSMNK